MGFKFRQSIGPKGFKINIGRRGITSVTTKIAPGITHNSKRGTTVGIPGTGLSYNFGNNSQPSENVQSQQAVRTRVSMLSAEYTKGWRAYTGGHNKKALIFLAVCFVISFTPLWPLGLVALMPTLVWILVDTIRKMLRYNKYLKNQSQL